MVTRRAASLATLAILFALGAGATPAVAKDKGLRWEDCGDGFQCATAAVPKDYGKRRDGTLDIAVIRKPATDRKHRIGSLFVNYGGPGGDGVQTTRDAYEGGLFDTLNDRFDIVSFDPRGTGQSERAIDCKANQETDGVYSKPFPTPLDIDVRAFARKSARYVRRCLDLNPDIFPYAATANVARDMDLLRDAVGDRKLTYLGFSYGTFLGATYESLFPSRHRALVLDGALDPDQYINRQEDALREQTAGFERAIGRFLQACASDKATCPFGGADPWDAYDQLIEQADAAPLANGLAPDRPVNGDDIRNGSLVVLYNKGNWAFLAQALSEAENGGDASLLRFLADLSWGATTTGPTTPGPIATSRCRRPSSATRSPGSATTWRPAPTRGRCSTTSGSTPGTPSTPGACSRSWRATSSTDRSAPRGAARRRSSSAPPTTRPRRIAARGGRRPSSATRGC